MLSRAPELFTSIFAETEMADLVRAYDWTSTCLGPITGWPAPLIVQVNQILDSSFPMFIWWGPDKIQFYNDAYLQILATDVNSKHPKALGQKGAECWPEIWEMISPLLEGVLQTGKPVFLEDQLIPIYRYGQLDKVYWKFSYNLIREADGSTGGILVICSETTQKVKFQQDIAAFNEELASTNEELLASNEDLNLSREELIAVNAGLEHRVNERTQELLNAIHAAEGQRQRLASIVAQVPAGLAILSGQAMKLELANDYMLSLWGRTESALGKELLEFLPELKEQAFPGILDRVFTTGEAFFSNDAAVQLHREGTSQQVFMDFSYTPLINSSGSIDSILVLAEEVTERTLSRQREQQLAKELSAINEEMNAANEELTAMIDELAAAKHDLERHVTQLGISESRFQNLVREASMGIIVLSGENLEVVIVNDAYAKLIGRTAADLSHQPLFKVIPESEKDFRTVIEHVRDLGEAVYLYDAPYSVLAHGKKIEGFLDLVYQPYREADGTITGTMVLCQDVSERVRAKKELQESEQRFHFMLDAIPQQVWTATPDGALNYVNQNISREFGRTGEEIVGDGWQAFIHPEDLPKAIKAWLKALASGEEYQVEFRLKFKDGEYYWHLARALALIEDGQIKLWMGTNTNIHGQKTNEYKKDEFLSIASHELKTPLTSIKAFNQLMKRAADPAKLEGFITKSAQHIHRLERLIADLLDVTKINAGKMNYELQPFDFQQMLTESIESVQHMSPAHRIILETNCVFTYTGDRFRLEQVVNNFLNNAVKYSPDGKEVLVTCRIEEDSIVVSVQDFGIGIAKESLDKLFDRYYRVDNTAMRFEGLGLGLFISSEILKRHNGTFWIESELGKGSVFNFRLPLDAEKASGGVIDSDTFYQDELITIKFNESQRRLDVDWKGYQTFKSVQHGGMMMLDKLIKNKCDKVLNDNRHVLGTWSDAADWAGTVWFPMMEEAGLLYFAWIFSHSAFAQLSAKKSVDVMNGQVTVQFFTEIADASDWLDGQ